MITRQVQEVSNDWLTDAWENFVFHNKIDKRIRPEIIKSWQRCKKLCVDPLTSQIAEILAKNDFNKIQKRKKHLIRIAKPYIRLLNEYVKESGFIIFLADENGTVLVLDGDPEELLKHRKINLIEGAIWTEKAAGTNAVGTSIYMGKPLQVVGREHFCAVQHGITCSGAPIYDTNGHLLGILNMSGACAQVNRHTLGMVVACAKAIQNQLKIEQTMFDLEKNNLVMNTTLESVPSAIITVDIEGTITHLNTLGAKLLDVNPKEAVGKPFHNLLPTAKDFTRLIRKGTSRGVEVFLGEGENSLRCNLLANPIQNNGRYKGSVIYLQEREKVDRLVNQITGAEAEFYFDSIVGSSKPILRAKEIAHAAAMTNSTVLLLGESGTGKELFAQAIHNASLRKGAFIAVNCSAIPRSLIESELFGYEAGSFTGANRSGRPGKFERAHEGTILLDEIGDMPLDLQAVLLRVLQERAVVRVGGYQPIPVDARVIAATNSDLHAKVEGGEFREDLFFRLNVITIHIPSLRERKDDIPILVDTFLPQINRRMGKQVSGLTPGAMRILEEYDWPGNVRELENVLERSVVIANKPVIDIQDLPANLLRTEEKDESRTVIPLHELEKKAISHALKEYDTMVEAADALGISRSTLYRKIKDYGLEIVDS
ncbi:MAG TPA: sigma 54-interacting transcriptional regulator [Syntrophomonadaceae bacterium]|nr:sigma 54-interacting transcriptional regulator [Syntrophomonadaceae bacterium]